LADTHRIPEMAKPNTRVEFKEYCLRKLGAPVLKINVDDDQVDDRVDEAILLFESFHQEGKNLWYAKYTMDSNNTYGTDANGLIQTANAAASNNVILTNKFILLDESVIGVTRIFPLTGNHVGTGGQGFNMFDLNYQIRLNEMYSMTNGDMQYFEMANQYLRTMEMMFIGDVPIRFNKFDIYNGKPRLFIDGDFSYRLVDNQIIVIECFRRLDASSAYWSEPWLQKYATSLIKEQWGTNIKKFASATLPGGMVLNGQQIYDEAIKEKAELEEKLRSDFEDPPMPLMG